jgi:hypothetical protein
MWRQDEFRWIALESISPTFKKGICANFLAPIKSLTFTASTKKLCSKLSYKKAACKMLVKLTPGVETDVLGQLIKCNANGSFAH